MDYKKFNLSTWDNLNISDDTVWYHSILLSSTDNEESSLHIFKDKDGHAHFAIEVININKNDLVNPQVNGLQLSLTSYKLNNGMVRQFIDIMCNIIGYLEEFTEVIKEIAKSIFEKEESTLLAVNGIINTWISFWSKQRNELLSEEEQTGLICELLILKRLCEINPKLALKSWTGPLGEKHDFNFCDWTFEVKGTRRGKRIHIINGLDQLIPYDNKRLAFISFLITKSDNLNSINLSQLIEYLRQSYFQYYPELFILFNELICKAGYNLMLIEDYKAFNIEIIDSKLFIVDDTFPKLTSDMLRIPLNSKVSSVTYDISLEGINGIDINIIRMGDFLY